MKALQWGGSMPNSEPDQFASVLAAIIEEFAQGEGNDEAFKRLADRARQLVRGRVTCRVLLLNETEELLIVAGASPERSTSQRIIQLATLPEFRAFLDGKSQRRYEYEEHRWLRDLVHRPGDSEPPGNPHCALLVPIVDDRTIGLFEYTCNDSPCELSRAGDTPIGELTARATRPIARMRAQRVAQRRLKLLSSLPRPWLQLHREQETKLRGATARMAARLLGWDMAAIYHNHSEL